MWPFTRQQPTPVAVSIQQRSEIMGRIHASNVASIADAQISLRSGEDYKKALERVQYKLNHQALRTALYERRKAMGYDDAKDPATVNQTLGTAMRERRRALGYDAQDPAVGVLKQIVGLLERADLTINVKPLSWFFDESRIKAKGPESFWAHVDQKKGYAARREGVEDELFQYSAPTVPNSDRYQTVAAGVKKYGSPALKDDKVTNPDFSPGSRPVYAALNWLSLVGGGAYKYGHVYFVLNTYIKHKATFLHGDTFHAGVANAANLANHFNYYPLVCNCKDNVLDAMMSPKDAKSESVAREEYIDAQIHTSVLFNRDVKAVYFLRGDFLRNNNLGGAVAFNKVKPNFEKFCKYNGLTPTYVD